MATMGAGGQKLYVDGALTGSNANTISSSGWSPGYWHVGCNSLSTGFPSTPTSAFLNGTVDEVSIFTVELDAAAIAYRHALVDRPLTTYARAVTARTPTLYWKFDETAGNPTDSSGNARNGPASGSGITRQQRPGITGGTAWSFNGTTGCTVSAASSTNPTDYSEELWFNTTTSSGGGLIGFTDSSASTNAGISSDRMIYMTNAGTINLGSTDANVVSSPAAYNDGQWHHVVGSVGTRGTRLYVDGELVASSAATAVFNFTGYWHVGCTHIVGWPSTPTSTYLGGAIDDVAVHPVQLSDEAVRWHYRSGARHRSATISGASTITTISGTGTASSTGDDGAATSATINSPEDATVDGDGRRYGHVLLHPRR